MSAAPERAGAILSIDLDALRDNYRFLVGLAGTAETAASVKANAYGTGLIEAAQTLCKAGCSTFFVAFPDEGSALRAALPEVAIYVLGGLFPDESRYYDVHRLQPVLNQPEELAEWSTYCRKIGAKLPAAIHVETGIHRLGFEGSDIESLVRDSQPLSNIDLTLLVGHLASADDPAAELNEQQRGRFEALRARLPPVRASLANSPGMFLGREFLLDLVRPGVGLYGGNPFASRPNPFKTVARLHGKILQLKTIARGESVGYGGLWTAPDTTRLAIVGAGYADGYPRSVSPQQDNTFAKTYIAGHFAPIVGRVSMDVITVNVSKIPEAVLSRNTPVELIGEHVTLEDVARWAGTQSYEILTRLGSRYHRRYSGSDSQ